MHVIEEDVTRNERPLPRKPQHRVLIGIAPDVLEDFDPGVFKYDEVIVIRADRNGVGSRTRTQDAFPFVYFVLIDSVDSTYYVGIRKNPDARVGLFKDLQPKKMVGMLVSDVDNR